METNYISLHQYVLSKWQVYWTASREEMMAAQQQLVSPISSFNAVVESEAARREKRVCVEQQPPEDSPRSIAGDENAMPASQGASLTSPRNLAADVAAESTRSMATREVESPRDVDKLQSSTTRVALLNEKLFNSFMHASEPIILLTPTTSHSLLSWSNRAYRNVFGWSFGDVIGHELFFMHGDAANVIPLAKRFKDVEASLKEVTGIEQRFYTHDGTLVNAKVTLFPIMEPNADPSKPMVAFLGLKFVEVNFCVFPADMLNPVPRIFEVGLPMDRREYCKCFRDYYGKPSERNCIFNDAHFTQFCHKASFTNVISLMMATPDCMLICNR
jgi:PAS domain-containing protein